MLKIGQPFRCDCGEDMATNGFEKTSARHEMQCLALNESFNVECIDAACAFSLRGGRIMSCGGGCSSLRRRSVHGVDPMDTRKTG